MSNLDYEPRKLHVGVITYQVGHLKTWQITRSLLTKGYRITLFAFPFKPRTPQANKPARFKDRPDQLIDLDMQLFCRQRDIKYLLMSGWADEFAGELGEIDGAHTPDIYLHCIAKIIPASFIKDRIILNCHPGLLPHNRGVDAFKRAIVNKWPIGVTLHAIDHEIDRGQILYRMRVPVFPNDTLDAICKRAYEFELDLQTNFAHHMHRLNRKDCFVGDEYPCSHEMIPIGEDQRLEQIFKEHRNELHNLSFGPNAQPHLSDDE